MAETVGAAFLSSFLQAAFEKLASSEMYDFFRGRNLKEGLLEKLHIILISVNQVIDDAEERQYRNQNVKKWLDELKHQVFKAEDLLDEIATEASLQKLASRFQNASRKVRGFFHCPVSLFDETIESRLQQVLDNLEYLIKQNEILGLKADFGTVGTQVGVNRKLFKRIPTSSLIDESAMYGRDADKESIIDKLLSHCGNQPVNVIAITGLGGMGKTTLARLVYEDERMKDQFQLRVWLTISEEFDVLLITKEILEKLECPTKDSDDPRLKLKEILKGKTFFVVLDDVWNENRQMWEALQVPFNYGASGSKILVTTRNKKVADVMNSVHVHLLKQLEDANCWKLFAKHAFSNQQNGMDPDLVSIGKKIVEKCGGLPLAIKSLGSLLRTKLSPKDWTKILDSDMWNLSENDSNIIPSLRLSYHYLPSNLKQCFAYCSVFPKDYEIDKDVLIQLWMAEGLLFSSLRGQSMQEVGNEFFNDLESRSFFEPSKSNEDYFVMHDLVNDLAKSVAGEFCLQLESDWAGDIPIKVRYLSYFGQDRAKVQYLPFSACSQFRSLMLFGRWSFIARKGDIVDNLFSRATHFNHMRVLSLDRYSHVKWLRNSIGHSKHLRYLDFSHSRIKKLPSSICLMINLQTLKLKGCKQLTKLPSDIKKLINLCHLDLEGSGLEKMPKYMGKLKQLETMSQFVVGEKKGYDLKELGALNRIRGTLVISKLENVIDPTTAIEAQIKDRNLKKLKLRWKNVRSQRVVEEEEQILVALQPNCDIIKKVVVQGYRGAKFPNWFSGLHLPNVVSLKLSNCISCTNLPPLGQLPLLKKLEISGFDGVKLIGEEFYGNGSSSFRSLTYLSFSFMKEWEEWSNKCGDEESESSFPCLEELYIMYCPKLRKSLPQHLPSLKKLQLCRCDNLESSVPKASRRRLRDESNSAEIPSLPHQHQHHALLSSLSSLRIYHCPKMMDWDLHHHHSLEEITITDEEVESFPEEGLLPPNLKSLQFQGCLKLKEINYKGLLHLQSLQSLQIDCSPNLSFESIPEVDGFPKSLSHLSIKGYCPLVEQRCEREKGQDWHKISHIPNIDISHYLSIVGN